jgi:hypothetical protein
LKLVVLAIGGTVEGAPMALLRLLASVSLLASTSASAGNTYEKGAGVGSWGGSCTCPNGQVYDVGDSGNTCESLACEGGIAGENAIQNFWFVMWPLLTRALFVVQAFAVKAASPNLLMDSRLPVKMGITIENTLVLERRRAAHAPAPTNRYITSGMTLMGIQLVKMGDPAISLVLLMPQRTE